MWAIDVRRTDAPVVVWDLRGSQRPNSPRGIATPVFPLRCASLIRRAKRRLRGAWPAPDGPGRPAPARRGRAASVRAGSAGFSPPSFSWLPAFRLRQGSGGPAVASAEAGQPEGCCCRPTLRRLRRAAPALAVRSRLPRSGKPSRLVPSLRSLPRRVGMRVGGRCQAHRCAGGGVGSTRITETELAARNRRAGFPAPVRFADQGRSAASAARGPLQTAAAAQHRHAAGGRR